MGNRNPYFDFLRGVAIIMVVGIHTFPSVSFASWSEIASIIIRQTLNCAVPLFVAISGFFLGRKELNTVGEAVAFYKSQIPKIYVPCLMWSVPYFIWDLATAKHGVFLSVAMLFCCVFGISYFIAVIVQYYLLLPLLSRINNLGGVIVSVLLSAVSVAIFSWFAHVRGYEVPLIVNGGVFPFWIMFFMMGLYLSKHNRSYGLMLPSCCAVMGVALQFAEAYCLFNLHGKGFGIKASSFFYAAAVIATLFSDKVEKTYDDKNRVMRAVRYIGNISFGIYLTHLFVIILTGHMVSTGLWLIRWMLTLVIVVALISAAHKVLPVKAARILGLFKT